MNRFQHLKTSSFSGRRVLAGILASAILSGLYVRGNAGWILGFVLLVPWLRLLDGNRTVAGTLRCAYLMSVALTAAVFAWFGAAIGDYTQIGPVAGVALLLVAAPVLQSQLLAFALVRHLAGRRHGAVIGACAAPW